MSKSKQAWKNKISGKVQLWLKFQSVRYMDGAFSGNLPVLDENTVTVSLFCSESDIRPRDQRAQIFHVS